MPAGAADLAKRTCRIPTQGLAAARPEARARATGVCISWRIGPRAGSGGAELRWTLEGEHAAAALHTQGEAGPRPLASARITRRVRDDGAGLEHFEVDGLLWLTLRHGEGCGPSLLFARTTLLARLEIPGGRYSAPELA